MYWSQPERINEQYFNDICAQPVPLIYSKVWALKTISSEATQDF